ncbi:NrfD/PsrC family molybdoenzyme membrane anchor subunit [Paludisphaera soli]|uniref:NrfD/PsrC family molybdoenzyme membrane anchor subunit n=1 Tax=Paludisphaera soli TaxID=2712865 RepID=UPI0013ED0BF3|nr:NrfD/PsrC family molybdoenzyme membrane anchor subunit [Paludisphaera soli]
MAETPHDDGRRAPLPPVLAPGHTYGSVTATISDVVLARALDWRWAVGMGIASSLLMLFGGAVANLLFRGTGIWGINTPVMWGWAIINFVWWVGIGHAGTLISAILLLLKQQWRTSINRFAEAMTLFAVACAGMFPLLHMGRPWKFWWMMPYPNTMALLPQWRSPLVWDVFAVSTYATVSALFWYVGLIPDLATLRDRAKNKYIAMAYGSLALGWRGSARHWSRYKSAYMLLAAMSTPLVVSVHTVVSFDFAVSVIPGWHATIFPPYFVAGAIFSGFAMVVTLMVPLRSWFGLKDFITDRHLDNMAKIILATGMIVGYGYAMEFFIAWYSGNPYEEFLLLNARPFGTYSNAYRMMVFCNVIIPQLLWIPAIRRNPIVLWVISIFVNIGMWLERYVIVITSLSEDFLPSSWAPYSPTIWDVATFLGTLGLFTFLLFAFIRVLPSIAIAEMRELVHEKHHEAHAAHAGHGVDAAEAREENR